MRYLPEVYQPCKEDPSRRRVTVSSYFEPVDVIRDAEPYASYNGRSTRTGNTHWCVTLGPEPEQRHTHYFAEHVDRGQFVDDVLNSVLVEVYRAGILTVRVMVDDGRRMGPIHDIVIPHTLPVPCDDPLVDEAEVVAFIESQLPPSDELLREVIRAETR